MPAPHPGRRTGHLVINQPSRHYAEALGAPLLGVARQKLANRRPPAAGNTTPPLRTPSGQATPDPVIIRGSPSLSGIARPSPKPYIYGVGITQTPLPGPDAAAIGMAAFLAVYAKGIWALVKHFPVMAHEGMHAITATILGIRVRKVELKRNGNGATHYRVPAVGGRGFLTGFAGYLGPSAFGLAAAGLIKLGLIVAALWAAVIFLALLLLKVLRSLGFGWISVPVVIGLFVILNLYASVSLQVVMAYLITWVLLLSGFSIAVSHWTGAGDAKILKNQTHLPRWLWAVLWVAGTFGAVYLGFLLLVLRS